MAEDPSSDDAGFTTQIEELFERGYNVDKVLTELDLKGNVESERKVLELFRDRQKKKQDHTKRFVSSSDVATAAQNDHHKRLKQSGGHMTWVLERDASVEERLAAPLPVPRERPVTKPHVQNEPTSLQNVYPSTQSYGRGRGFDPQFHPGHFPFSRGRASRGYRGGDNAPWRGGGRGTRGRQQLPFSMGVQWESPANDDNNEALETEQREGAGGTLQHQEPETEKHDEQPQDQQVHNEHEYPTSREGFNQPAYYPRRGHSRPYSHHPRGAPWRGGRGGHQFQPRGSGFRHPSWSRPAQQQSYGNQSWTAQEETHQPDQTDEGADEGGET